MTGAALATARACLERAAAMKDSAARLEQVGDEWYAVCYFYAAYHTVKAAFIEDPIFSDLAALTAKNRFLTLQDRFSTSHKGYVNPGAGGRRMGVNDIVRVLYPEIGAEYERLHMASVEVRYRDGLRSKYVKADFTAIIDRYVAGDLKAE